MSDRQKLKAVEQYGKTYIQWFLANARDRREAITSDPLEALGFMFGKAFMRGRRDEVSVVFRDQTLEVLEQYRTLDEIDLSSLDHELHDHGVNNRYDRRMVIESIRFVRTNLKASGCNVYNWAVDAIRNGRAAEAYWALNRIHSIKDKIATFYLRDVAFLEDMEDTIKTEDYPYFQPVDTWVKRVASSLAIIDERDEGRHSVVKEKIISECLSAEVSPLLFNAGAWMVGAHAYELLIERL
jgi:hypothetical protein